MYSIVLTKCNDLNSFQIGENNLCSRQNTADICTVQVSVNCIAWITYLLTYSMVQSPS